MRGVRPGSALAIALAFCVAGCSRDAGDSVPPETPPPTVATTDPAAAREPVTMTEIRRQRARREEMAPTWTADHWAGERELPDPARAGERTRPEWRSGDRPSYSEEARRARIQGTVILELVVGRSGDVRRARVLRPLPMGLSQKAVDAAKTWRFEPALADGEPVPALLNISVGFSLPHSPVDPARPATSGSAPFYGMRAEEASSHSALLAANRRRWAGAEVYSYDLETTCPGPYGSSVRVRDEEVVEAGLRRPWPPYWAGPGPRPAEVTVPDLFAMVERALFQRVDSFRVEYDEELGFPRSFSWSSREAGGCEVAAFSTVAEGD